MQIFKNKSLLLTGVVMLVVGFSLGFLVSYMQKSGSLSGQTQSKSAQLLTNNFLSGITATFQGKVISINDRKITLQKGSGESQIFDLIEGAMLMPTGPKSASPSSSLNSLELNKEVLVNLIYSGSQFKVSSVMYAPVLPQVTPNQPLQKQVPPPKPKK